MMLVFFFFFFFCGGNTNNCVAVHIRKFYISRKIKSEKIMNSNEPQQRKRRGATRMTNKHPLKDSPQTKPRWKSFLLNHREETSDSS
jgi:hypothetical protein